MLSVSTVPVSAPRLKTLSLRGFRNFEGVQLILPAQGVMVIVGANGLGKTNLLEAMAVLSHGRSFRTSNERELLRHDATFATVSGQLEASSRDPMHLEARWQLDEGQRLRRRFFKNEVALSGRGALLGQLPSVVFTQQDLSLLRGAPEDRRRWLDMALVQARPELLAHLQRYERLRKQKAFRLKQALADGWQLASLANELDVWDTQLSEAGAAVWAGRLQYLQALRPLLQAHYGELGGEASHEHVDIGYQARRFETSELVNIIKTPPDATQLQASLAQTLAHWRADELRRGTCLVGPHRDDISMSLRVGGDAEPRDATAFGSQGQQRTFVLALKLAERDALANRCGAPPLMLLDDVMAELDPERQALLLERLAGAQVVMTTTHVPERWQQLNPERVIGLSRSSEGQGQPLIEEQG